MIWNSSQLQVDPDPFGGAPSYQVVSAEDFEFDKQADYIAIVAGGPYALTALINFLRIARISNKPSRKIQIHWYNRNAYFPMGNAFRADLPHYISYNQCVAQLAPLGQAIRTASSQDWPDLQSWIQQVNPSDRAVKPSDYCSRELFGKYLTDSLNHLLANLPDNIELKLIQSDIVDIDIQGKSAYLSNQKRTLSVPYQSVILCMGYQNTNDLLKFISNSEEQNDQYIGNYLPFSQLDQIPAQAPVAIKESGAHLIDVLLALTEGRGGIFYRRDHEFHYIPSGNEPKLYSFSRSNLPGIPRNKFWDQHRYTLRFMTEEWVQELQNRQRKIYFEQDILDILNKEIQVAFYSQFEPLSKAPVEYILGYIEQQDESQRFSIQALFDPWNYSNVSKNDNYNEFVLDLSIYCLQISKDGELASPLGAALGALREGYAQIAKLYAFSGFEGANQFRFDSYWNWYITEIVYGPIREQAEKFFCLLKDGYIEYIFSENPEIEALDSGFLFTTPDRLQQVSHIIDCSSPKSSIRNGENLLFQQMLEKGYIQEFENDGYRASKIELNRDGSSNMQNGKFPLYFYGPACEGAHLFYEDYELRDFQYPENWAMETLNLQSNDGNFLNKEANIA